MVCASSQKKTAQLPEKTAWVQNPGQVEARIAPTRLRFELPKYLKNWVQARAGVRGIRQRSMALTGCTEKVFPAIKERLFRG